MQESVRIRGGRSAIAVAGGEWPAGGWPDRVPLDTASSLPRPWSADEVAAHPGFGQVLRRFSTAMLATQTENVRLVFRDAGSVAGTAMLVHLQALGTPRLAAYRRACADGRLLSSGRSYVWARILEKRGLLTLTPDSQRVGGLCFAATPALLSLWRHWLRPALMSASLLEPAAGTVARRLDSAETVFTLARLLRPGFVFSTESDCAPTTWTEVVLHSFGGIQLTWKILAESPAGEEPGCSPLPLSLTAMSASFGPSRIHFRRMIAAGRAAGLMERTDEGFLLTQAARRQLRGICADSFAHLLNAALSTEGQLPGQSGLQKLPIADHAGPCVGDWLAPRRPAA